MQKVHVEIYERPLVAQVTYCAVPDECPLHEDGMCLIARKATGERTCPYGRVERYARNADGDEFRSRWQGDAAYGRLSVPVNPVMVFAVRELVFLRLGSVGINYDTGTDAEVRNRLRVRANSHGMWLGNPTISDSELWVPREAVDAEFFANVCAYRPRALLTRREIKRFRAVEVPLILTSVKRALPEVHEELVREHPELAHIQVSRVGMMAKAGTIRDGAQINTEHGTFTKRGAYMYCTDYRDISLKAGDVRARGGATVVLPIGPDDTVVIEDGDWVTEDTVLL